MARPGRFAMFSRSETGVKKRSFLVVFEVQNGSKNGSQKRYPNPVQNRMNLGSKKQPENAFFQNFQKNEHFFWPNPIVNRMKKLKKPLTTVHFHNKEQGFLRRTVFVTNSPTTCFPMKNHPFRSPIFILFTTGIEGPKTGDWERPLFCRKPRFLITFLQNLQWKNSSVWPMLKKSRNPRLFRSYFASKNR